MNVFKKIKKGFLILLACVYFAFVIFMTILLLNYNDYGVTEIGESTIVIINDSISSENYAKGDLVLVDKIKLEEVQQGQEVFAYEIDGKGKASIVLGKVGKIYPEEKAISYENGSTYAMDFVIGKESKKYEEVGKYLSIIESKWGFLFIILVPSFLIFIYEVYALIVEIKYGEDE